MAKLCNKCGKPIYGRARKYCPECKREEHLEQMHQNYLKNCNKWQYGGVYWNRRRGIQLCGTGGLGNKMDEDFDEELKKVEKEMINLGLRKPIK